LGGVRVRLSSVGNYGEFQGIAGASVRRTSRDLSGKAALRVALALALLILALLAAGAGTESFEGIGVLALVGAVGAFGKARRLRSSASRYRLGAEAEERVGARLDTLRGRGFEVEHDVSKPGRGNVDHVVHAGIVTFVIDTKRSTWRPSDLEQARRHSEWASENYGAQRMIVPVICVERRWQRPPELVEGIHVVGGDDICSFVISRG
jgi:hypothetical protein